MPMLGRSSWISAILATMLVSPFAQASEQSPESACMAGAPAGLEAHWQALCGGESKDMVLHRMRAGQAAFAAGLLQTAEAQFDAALTAIETVYVDTPSAEKARSLWYAEKVKDFKGEPYERVMAYYYRGLLYLLAGDWDNAQASFKGAILQDTFAASERARADVASMVWLAGWSMHCRGNDSAAKELFTEAAHLRPALQPPAEDANLLVAAETGTGPRKETKGKQNEKLAFIEGMVGNDRLTAVAGARRAAMTEAEDLFFQATSRGGRQMDELLSDKAQTKENTLAFGQGATRAGMAAMAIGSQSGDRGGRGASAVGGVAALVGMIAASSAVSMDAQADTRMWDTLPHSIHLAALPAPAGGVTPEAVDLLDGNGVSVLTSRSRVRTATSQSCSMAWIGSQSIMPSRIQPAAQAAPEQPQGPSTCRTVSGAENSLPHATCLRIGGTPL